jgi:hypothetical protein
MVSLLDGLAAATARAATPTSNPAKTVTFLADTLVHTQAAKGREVKHSYSLLGSMYQQFGVRIWPEVFPLIGLNIDDYATPGIFALEVPVNVRATLEEYKDKDTGEIKNGCQENYRISIKYLHPSKSLARSLDG